MDISSVISSPWAIMPDKLRDIKAVYDAHVSGHKIDIQSVEARLGKPLVSQDQGYQVIDGVAVIPISGVIGKKMNMMTQISGGASTQLIARDIKSALKDSSVNSILLDIESPGGTVDGTQNLADLVRSANAIKPVVAFADGLMASAAYWIGSAAGEIVASSATAQIGSIGVVITHTDVSKANENDGVKVTEISAGKYKRMASQNAPLSEEGEALLQDQVDQLYTIFVDAVAVNRGVDAETVLKDMADGRVFLSGEALKRGMIDRVATIEETIFQMSTGANAMTDKTTKQEASAEVITLDIIKNQYPDIAAALIAEGAKAENERIADCESSLLPGHEAIVSAMKADGKSNGSDVARAIIKAEKDMRATHLSDFQSNAPAPIQFAAAPAAEKTIDANAPIEERAKAEWDADANLRADYADNFVGFLGAKKAAEAGKIRVIGGK